MKKEYTVYAGTYEDFYQCRHSHKRTKIWRADVIAKQKEGFAWLQIKRLRKRFANREDAIAWAKKTKEQLTANNFFALRKL